MTLSCFKAYDIRGKVSEEFNSELAYKVGFAFAKLTQAKNFVIGYDARLDGPEITRYAACGAIDAGCNIIDIGLCGTEEIYFHSFSAEEEGVSGGMMITASHNPVGYNGIKLVGKGARAISSDGLLKQIHDYILNEEIVITHEVMKNDISHDIYRKEKYRHAPAKDKYIAHLLTYIDITNLRPLRLVVNSGNGCAGSVIDILEKILPFEFVKINNQPDGLFPNGVPNPMLIEQRAKTSQAILLHGADFGVAWDGDFDRCFLFDENGKFIEGPYLVGLLADLLLQQATGGEKIIYDPRVIWNILEVAEQHGAIALQNKAGHSFFKDRMRQENALYGGEASSHHYFRDFGYCDSGMVPWLLVAKMLSDYKEKKLSQIIGDRAKRFPCSGELNYVLDDPDQAIEDVCKYFSDNTDYFCVIDKTDGISLDLGDWRFNMRKSNTEALLRLNIEAKNSSTDFIENCRKKIESILKISV